MRISVLTISLLWAFFAYAQPTISTYQTSIETHRASLETIATQLDAGRNEDLIELRRSVREIRTEIQNELVPMVQAADALRVELDALGPIPAEGQPAESETIEAERARVSSDALIYETALRQANVNLAAANRVLDQIAIARRDAFFDNILMSGDSPLDPDVISPGVAGAFLALEQVAASFDSEIDRREARGSLMRDVFLCAISFLIALILVFPVRRRLNAQISARMQANEPTQSRRAIAAAARTASRVIPGLIGGAIIYEILRWLGLFGADTAALAQVFWTSFIAILAVDGATAAMLSPNFPGWRVIPLKSSRARVVRTLLISVSAILGLDAILRTITSMLGSPQETVILQSGAVAFLLAVIAIVLTRPSLWALESSRAEEIDGGVQRTFRILSLFVLTLGAAAITGTALGYVAFGYFVTTRAFFVAALAAGGWFLRGLVREALTALDSSLRPAVQPDEAQFETSKDRGNILIVWLGLFLDVTVLAVFTIPAFLVLGADWSDVRDTVIDLYFGFKVGSVTISIADVFAAVMVFVAILAITRFIQRSAETRLFPQLRVDPGIRNSFRTLIGYAGILIAFISAVGAVGFDLSSLAIVAGALSVGIGFGLQSIVSNFVSGLILLFERPIKVGDWIVVPSGEGFVRRISVRSTEIQTFDRSSVIVPNSELISGTVTNLTHGDNMGRVKLPVGVSYNEDPERVMQILDEIARAHPKILKNPEPFIFFFGFGDSSLDFEIRAFIKEVVEGIRVQNDLRVSIFKRFRDEGIEIPFPQRVVHVQKKT